MATLNIVNKSPFEKRTLEQCLPRISDGDSVLLIEDACVAAVSGTTFEPELKQSSGSVKLYVLEPDLAARGLSGATLMNEFATVDYAGFVELVSTHDRVHSWL
ncbi:MAG: sulfurtransferase complex subunit TusB [Gammaproteobacteria bacterium]|nr:sulfurtransferase complex subunit TusB [Gammaproteobacteria bacterium]